MPTTEQNPRTGPLGLSALCGLLAPITFLVGWVAGGLAQPDAYSSLDDEVSDLGALTADQAWIYNQIGANLTGLLVTALAYGLWRAGSYRPAGRAGVIALAVMGVGVFLDGWLRLDCRAIDTGCDTGGTSWHATAHQIESLITVSAMFVSVFALARAFKKSEHWNDLRMPTLIAGVVTVAAILGGTLLTGFQLEGAVSRRAPGSPRGLPGWRSCHIDCGRPPNKPSTPNRRRAGENARFALPAKATE